MLTGIVVHPVTQTNTVLLKLTLLWFLLMLTTHLPVLSQHGIVTVKTEKTDVVILNPPLLISIKTNWL